MKGIKLTCLMALVMVSTEAFAQSSPVRGVLRPIEEAVISTDLSARIDHIAKRAGERFEQGALLVEFDCERYKAEVRAARAAHAALTQEYETNLQLIKYDAIGTSEVEISRTRMVGAAAQADIASTFTKDCEIKAPFSGRVVEVAARTFETNVPGQPIMRIIDDSKLEVELIVPSSWLVWLKPGTEFSFHVDETQSLHDVIVDRIGGEIDPVSQTARIYGLTGDNHSGLLSGMSGSASFDLPVN